MEMKDRLNLAGVLVSLTAVFISLGVLFQMQKDTNLAREDSELRIRPIVFVKNVQAIVSRDGDIKELKLSVINAGLGPALNVSSVVQSDIVLPSTGVVLKKNIFGSSTILQVLPNAEAKLQGTLSVSVPGNNATINLDNTQLLPDEFIANSAVVTIPVLQRPDEQNSINLTALTISKEEFDIALNDALFVTQCTSMTNKPISYENRPKRSDTLKQVKQL
jgi:hypothetical protein